MEKIILSTKKELEIYMNPVRQQLIRILEKSRLPMTPKMLADQMDISPSSVQHHIKKLMSLDLLELDHTELIHGITARYYKSAYASVQIGLQHNDDTASQREVFLQEKVAQTYDGFITQKRKVIDRFKGSDQELKEQWGDVMTGVLHLTADDARELFHLISGFIETHGKPVEEKETAKEEKPAKGKNSAKETNPWEYALILYNAREDIDE